MHYLLAVLFVLLVATPTSAEVFMYQDSSGKWHGVSSVSQVPEEYQNQIQSVVNNDTDKASTPEPVSHKKQSKVVVVNTKEVAPEEKEEDKITTRVKGYMDAVLADDWEKAYEFVNKDVTKATFKEHFERQKRLEEYGVLPPTEYSIKNVRIDPKYSDKATTKVVEMVPTTGGDIHITTDQVWVKEVGEWYRKVQDAVDATKAKERDILNSLRK